MQESYLRLAKSAHALSLTKVPLSLTLVARRCVCVCLLVALWRLVRLLFLHSGSENDNRVEWDEGAH